MLNDIDPAKYVLARCPKMDLFPDGTLDAEIHDLDQVRDRDVIYLASRGHDPPSEQREPTSRNGKSKTKKKRRSL